MAQILQVFADFTADQPGTSDDDDLHVHSPESGKCNGN
jgi:hypothetical protein